MGIKVFANQGLIDTLQTVGRLTVIITSTLPIAALLLQKHDLIGLYNYFQGNQGQALIGAVSGLVALGYGIYKSYKRGAQVATVAASPSVPSNVADLK